MQAIKWFKDIRKEDVGSVGGKGANLGEMWNNGFPVPGGFAITAQAYAEFRENAGIRDAINDILKTIDAEDSEDLQKKANRIQKIIVGSRIPEDIASEIEKAYDALEVMEQGMTDSADIVEADEEPFVACRSSATAEDLPEASFAGQQATFLNVKGASQVLDATRKCWASLFTARAIYYREKNKFDHDQVLISVIVQKMVNSEKAGIMFSINPATNNSKEIMIEAVYGLGETIVGGQVNPDLYIIDKELLEIKQKEVKSQRIGLFRNSEGKNVERNLPVEDQGKQKLSDKEIEELAGIGKKIEKHYGKAQDIEWAVEKGRIYIVQSRAVTTLKRTAEELKEEAEEEGKIEGNILTKGLTASGGTASGPVKVIHDLNELDRVLKGDVLVVSMTNPDMVPAMKRAAAIVTDEGGITCHAAIVSREMGVPCIVGTTNATSVLKDGQIITVAASHGVVFEGKVGHETSREIHAFKASKLRTKTQVKVIADLPEYAERAATTGADGVGLCRLEFMIADNGVHPAWYIREGKEGEYTAMLVENLSKIAGAFEGKPVWVRTSDIRTDEYRNLKGADREPKESDPMIVWHAIRRGLDEPKILKAEFQAVKELHKRGFTNVGVMIPFVIRASEVAAAKEIMREVGMEPLEDVEFGVMVETPAACWIIDELCREGISFVSFGTNDLTQLTLGIDRNNEKIAKLFDEMHPAVLGEIEMVLSVAKKYGVQTSICGQAGSKPEMARFLVKRGCTSISANPDAVAKIRETVAKVEKELGVK